MATVKLKIKLKFFDEMKKIIGQAFGTNNVSVVIACTVLFFVLSMLYSVFCLRVFYPYFNEFYLTEFLFLPAHAVIKLSDFYKNSSSLFYVAVWLQYFLTTGMLIWLTFSKVTVAGNKYWVLKILGDPACVVKQGTYFLPFVKFGLFSIYEYEYREENFTVPITMRTVFNQSSYCGWTISDCDLKFRLVLNGGDIDGFNRTNDVILRGWLNSQIVEGYRCAISNYDGVSEFEMIQVLKNWYHNNENQIRNYASRLEYELVSYNAPIYATIDSTTRATQETIIRKSAQAMLIQKIMDGVAAMNYSSEEKIKMTLIMLQANDYNVPRWVIKEYIVNNNSNPLFQSF